MNIRTDTEVTEDVEKIMKVITRALLATTAAATALSLSACDPVGGTSAKSSSPGGKTAAPTKTESPTNTPSESESSSTESSPTSSTSPSESSTPTPSEGGDTAAVQKQPTNAIPSGPMTRIELIQSGGYRKYADSEYAKFYAVMKVDGTAGGLAKVQFEMLDSSGKVVGTTDNSIHIGKGKDMIKVLTLSDKAPESVARVRLKVLSNEENQYGQDMTITGVSVKNHAKSDQPEITGRYRTLGDATAITINAICTDAKGNTLVGSGVVPRIKAPDGDNFTINMYDAPKGWEAKNCYVGQ